jgi:hypothetical protein
MFVAHGDFRREQRLFRPQSLRVAGQQLGRKPASGTRIFVIFVVFSR